MPTIKRKVEMNLPQLIEWLFSKKNLDDEIFLSNKHNSVQVTDDGILEFLGTFYDDTFTVEVEEQIDEETLIPKLIVEYSYCSDVDLYKCFKVGDFMNDNAKSIYILNDDLTTTLIWTREKGLIE